MPTGALEVIVILAVAKCLGIILGLGSHLELL